MDEPLVAPPARTQPAPAVARAGRLPLSGRVIRLALAALVVAVGGLGLLAWRGAGEAPARELPPPQVREFTLVAEQIRWEIEPGVVVDAWAYNGQVPGPEIRVNEGDTVRITLVNRLPVGTTLHAHGIDNTPAMDGPAGLNQAAIEPGQDFVYEFVADPAGSRMYHAHADPTHQIALGLYGPMIVEPRDQDDAPAYDREYTVMLAEWDLELTPDVATGAAPKGPGDAQLRGGELGADLFLMNGRAHDGIPPVRLAEGERVLIRLMNLGGMPHPIHTHGHSFTIVATDGNPVPAGLELTKDTVLIAPGERYDLLIEGTNPGVWMLHCHIENHADNGMMTTIAYDGQVPTGPLAELWGDGTIGMDHGAEDPGATSEAVEPTAAPAETATPVASPAAGNARTAGAAGPTVEVAVTDNRFGSGPLTVAPGTTVVWVNRGHNMHTVASFDGLFNSIALRPGETYSYTFTEPGEYRYICKQHGRQGMLGTIVVA